MIPSAPWQTWRGWFHSLPALGNSGAEEQSAQVLFHRPGTDAELAGYFLIAATLRKQSQNFFVAGRNFDGVQVDHCSVLLMKCRTWVRKHGLRQTFAPRRK
jgi:hypothetical protein